MDEGKGKASGDLLLTRLTKKRLSELGLRLSGDSGLYIEGELLDQLARSDPEGYLGRIAKIKKAVLSAEFLSSPKTHLGPIGFAKAFEVSDGIGLLRIEFTPKGKPRRYCLSLCKALGPLRLSGFARCAGKRSASS